MLLKSVRYIKGVGDKFAEDLVEMNIITVNDLLYTFPFRYSVMEVKKLRDCVHEEQVALVGRVIQDPILNFYGRKKSRLTFLLEVEGVVVKAVMFNRAFAKKQMKIDDIFTVTGKWDAHRLQITVSYYLKGTADEEDKIEPIYSVKGNVKMNRLKNTIRQAMKQYNDDVIEFLPRYYLDIYKLPNRKEALETIHQPKNKLALKHARRRYIYEEFILFQLKVHILKKQKREETKGNSQQYDSNVIKDFTDQLDFKLTQAQSKSLNEILSDMKTPFRMNRLLQGDVGSGKTVVAAICLYASITAYKQGALMVPTEILAEQHYQSLSQLFDGKINIALLTGSTKSKERKRILQEIKQQKIDLVVGTHALIQDDVYFADLGLVIVDEQHRFGVEQRRKLRDKGLHPDVLFMTATPIPRTLAITTFGDMDISVIDEMPMGRKEIETYWTNESTFERVLNFIYKRVQAGEQAYVICPLIEESDKLDIQNAVDLYTRLQQFYPKDVMVGLIHGRLTMEEKDDLMARFENNELHILVSTTVVEVGVNVPNATVMVIYDAQRFGLSQLHQLRGRVGRGDKQSYCILIADPKGEIGKERMKIMTETNDGFELSEHDLKLRGSGDFFGKKQSGLPDFKIADPILDYRALEVARNDAQQIVQQNLLETDETYSLLKQHINYTALLNEKLD